MAWCWESEMVRLERSLVTAMPSRNKIGPRSVGVCAVALSLWSISLSMVSYLVLFRFLHFLVSLHASYSLTPVYSMSMYQKLALHLPLHSVPCLV